MRVALWWMYARKSYQKLFDSAAAMKSEFSDLNDKLFSCRMVSVIYLLFLF